VTVPAVVLTGAPATGKSTLGTLLAGRLRAAVIDQDVATQPLVDVVASLVGVTDLDDPRLASVTRAARYEVVTALAEANLRAGTPVVLVAPFTSERASPAAWALLHDRLAAAGGRPVLVWLSLSAAEIVARLRARGAVRDAAKLADPGYAATLSPAAPVVPHLEVPAGRPPAELARVVVAHLTRG
jgi:predicted kinase